MANQIGIQKAINRVIPAGAGGRQLRTTGCQRGFVSGRGEGNAGVPSSTRRNPSTDRLNFLRRHSGPLGGHLLIGVGTEHELEELAVGRFARNENDPVFAPFQQRLATVHRKRTNRP